MRNIDGKKRGKRINERIPLRVLIPRNLFDNRGEPSSHTSYLRYFDLDIRSDRARDINRELAG